MFIMFIAIKNNHEIYWIIVFNQELYFLANIIMHYESFEISN